MFPFSLKLGSDICTLMGKVLVILNFSIDYSCKQCRKHYSTWIIFITDIKILHSRMHTPRLTIVELKHLP